MVLVLGPISMIAIYITVWWVVLFAILPLGMSQAGKPPPTDGSDWGAPDDPKLKKKFLTTTWVSFVVWAIMMLVVQFGLIPLPHFSGPA